jgi:hypothetical protein
VEKLTVWKLITTEFNGRLVNGSYAVEDAMVKVKTWRGEKAIQGNSCNSISVAGALVARIGGRRKRLAQQGAAVTPSLAATMRPKLPETKRVSLGGSFW